MRYRRHKNVETLTRATDVACPIAHRGGHPVSSQHESSQTARCMAVVRIGPRLLRMPRGGKPPSADSIECRPGLQSGQPVVDPRMRYEGVAGQGTCPDARWSPGGAGI